jgi:hypothetical protein
MGVRCCFDVHYSRSRISPLQFFNKKTSSSRKTNVFHFASIKVFSPLLIHNIHLKLYVIIYSKSRSRLRMRRILFQSVKRRRITRLREEKEERNERKIEEKLFHHVSGGFT